MRLPHFVLLICSLTMIACSAIAATATAALDRFGRMILDVIGLAPRPFALAGVPNTPMTIGGVALARSTQMGLRHEAGVSRRASARNV